MGKIQYQKPVRDAVKEHKFRKIRRSEIPTLLQRLNKILPAFSNFFFRFEYSSIQEASNKQLLSRYNSSHTGTMKVIPRFGTQINLYSYFPQCLTDFGEIWYKKSQHNRVKYFSVL
jgi:hypothetical protein